MAYSAYDNYNLSLMLSTILIRGLIRSSYDESKLYLDAIYAFLNFRDVHTLRRFEWLIGVSQLITNKYNDFALAGGLGEQIYTYSSTIENSKEEEENKLNINYN